MRKQLKMAAFAALLAVGFTANAQRTDTSANAGTDFTRQANTVLGEDGGSVKVVDNKGTIKYLQASNGVTMFTDTAPNGGVITTWQLGGTLTDETYITAGANTEFNLDGLELVGPALTQAEFDAQVLAGTLTDTPTTRLRIISTTATDRGIHGAAGVTGFTVLIRDEVSGAIKKMQLTDLFQVKAIGADYTQSAGGSGTPDAAGNATANVTIPVGGLPILTTAMQARKLFVFRNGVKLRWGVDFTTATADEIVITYNAVDMPMYNGDVIEVQYIE